MSLVHRLTTVLALTLLVAACKGGGEKHEESTLRPSDQPCVDDLDRDGMGWDTLRMADTTTHAPAVKNDRSRHELQLHTDSAEITNLRLLGRKQRVIYDASLLVGEWIRGSEHEVYFADGTGLMWDAADDVSRDEAQRFDWSLDSNMLTIFNRLEMGIVVPKRFVVTYADDESLSYTDPYGKAFLWDKN